MPKSLLPDDDPPPMRPGRYRYCLELLRLGHSDLAKVIGCARPLPGQWASGARSVPPEIAAWLEECLRVRAAAPYPKPPKNWRRSRRGRYVGYNRDERI